MSFLYELAVMGSPSDGQVRELEFHIATAVENFGLQIGREIDLQIRPVIFNPEQQRASAVVFFGGLDAPLANLENILRKSIPVLPVVSAYSQVKNEIPTILKHLNCLASDSGGSVRIATALLECAGLLHRQRRVFLSYRRDEARQVALQLFDVLSAKHFEVFLDTHDILPSEDFQAMLWHRLCDSDVLIMLDTPTYFASRWTSAEFGRALAKGISVLRVGWPNGIPSIRTSTCSRVELLSEEIDSGSGRLVEEAIDRICSQLENVRSQSIAVRNLNLVSNLRNSVEMIGGTFEGVGLNKAVYIKLADGREVAVFPTVGIPTSKTLHDAMTCSPDRTVAVLYDHIGVHTTWLSHLDWLNCHIKPARCVKSADTAWQFADWEAQQ